VSDEWAEIDVNSRQSLTATSNVDGSSIVRLYADPVTHRLLVDIVGGGGTGTWYAVSGTIDGVNPTFTLPVTPTSDFVLVLGGQTQILTKWYTVSGNTITYQAGYIPIGIPTDEHMAFVIT